MIEALSFNLDTLILALVLVQSRWTHPAITEKLLTGGGKESNQTKKKKVGEIHCNDGIGLSGVYW